MLELLGWKKNQRCTFRTLLSSVPSHRKQTKNSSRRARDELECALALLQFTSKKLLSIFAPVSISWKVHKAWYFEVFYYRLEFCLLPIPKSINWLLKRYRYQIKSFGERIHVLNHRELAQMGACCICGFWGLYRKEPPLTSVCNLQFCMHRFSYFKLFVLFFWLQNKAPQNVKLGKISHWGLCSVNKDGEIPKTGFRICGNFN